MPNLSLKRIDGERVTYGCVDPSDPHSGALVGLQPPGMLLLAWPTQQCKP